MLSRGESDAVVDRIEAHCARHGFGFWVIEIPNVDPFIGCVGLLVPRFEGHFTPCVEIGWRIAAQYWSQGYATEAARAVLHFGFERLNLSEIVALTVPANAASRRVMENIGMTYDPPKRFRSPLDTGWAFVESARSISSPPKIMEQFFQSGVMCKQTNAEPQSER